MQFVPAKEVYVKPDAKIRVGDQYYVDSGMGGAWSVMITEVGEKIKCRPTNPQYFKDEIPEWEYSRDAIGETFFELIPDVPMPTVRGF